MYGVDHPKTVVETSDKKGYKVVFLIPTSPETLIDAWLS